MLVKKIIFYSCESKFAICRFIGIITEISICSARFIFDSYGIQCPEDSWHSMCKPELSLEKYIMTGVVGRQD